MLRTLIWQLTGGVFLLVLSCAMFPVSAAGTVTEAAAILNGAEDRFVQPKESWFYETQESLRAAMQTVVAALDSQGAEYADPWKQHLRWELLERNLAPLHEIKLSEIELARRWMYSNRKGMEYPFFAELRKLTDAYLDAAYTLSQADLREQFHDNVRLARQQIAELSANPTDSNAAALGRTLGWFERTGQLLAEVEQLRTMLSYSNGQVLIGKALVHSIMASHSAPVEHSLPVSDVGQAPRTRRIQRPRTVQVSGTAHTRGTITLELVPNTVLAELSIAYDGHVDSHCTGNAGPLSFKLRTSGPMSATKPVTFDPDGIKTRTTSVIPHVSTHVTQISADSNFVRRVGERRINEPQNQSYMSSRARAKAVEMLEDEMDLRVEKAVDEIRTEIARMRASANEFSEVFAPTIREGAKTYFASSFSTPEHVGVNIESRRREQFGAPTPCPHDFVDSDVRVRVHVSFLNNMLETIMAGKMFTDEYFMKYAKVLQPTLPLDLMVHSRAPRWAIVAAKPRPLELRIPAPNRFEFALHIASLEVGGEKFTEPTTATVRYELVKNEFDEYYMRRLEDVTVKSTLSERHREFLQEKLNAFFAPVLDGGGVIVPEGGSIGSLNLLKFLGVKADQDWLAIGIGVPKEFLDQALKVREESTGTEFSAPLDETVPPPPFAMDEDLTSYPTGL